MDSWKSTTNIVSEFVGAMSYIIKNIVRYSYNILNLKCLLKLYNSFEIFKWNHVLSLENRTKSLDPLVLLLSRIQSLGIYHVITIPFKYCICLLFY